MDRLRLDVRRHRPKAGPRPHSLAEMAMGRANPPLTAKVGFAQEKRPPPDSRSARFLTVETCQRTPRAVRPLRSIKATARPRRLPTQRRGAGFVAANSRSRSRSAFETPPGVELVVNDVDRPARVRPRLHQQEHKSRWRVCGHGAVGPTVPPRDKGAAFSCGSRHAPRGAGANAVGGSQSAGARRRDRVAASGVRCRRSTRPVTDHLTVRLDDLARPPLAHLARVHIAPRPVFRSRPLS